MIVKVLAPAPGNVLAGGEGFEPPTSGSGGLCPIQARLPALRKKEWLFMYKRGRDKILKAENQF